MDEATSSGEADLAKLIEEDLAQFIKCVQATEEEDGLLTYFETIDNGKWPGACFTIKFTKEPHPSPLGTETMKAYVCFKNDRPISNNCCIAYFVENFLRMGLKHATLCNAEQFISHPLASQIHFYPTDEPLCDIVQKRVRGLFTRIRRALRIPRLGKIIVISWLRHAKTWLTTPNNTTKESFEQAMLQLLGPADQPAQAMPANLHPKRRRLFNEKHAFETRAFNFFANCGLIEARHMIINGSLTQFQVRFRHSPTNVMIELVLTLHEELVATNVNTIAISRLLQDQPHGEKYTYEPLEFVERLEELFSAKDTGSYQPPRAILMDMNYDAPFTGYNSTYKEYVKDYKTRCFRILNESQEALGIAGFILFNEGFYRLNPFLHDMIVDAK